jgi:hypothetical protein
MLTGDYVTLYPHRNGPSDNRNWSQIVIQGELGGYSLSFPQPCAKRYDISSHERANGKVHWSLFHRFNFVLQTASCKTLFGIGNSVLKSLLGSSGEASWSDVQLTWLERPGRDLALGACSLPNSADSRTFSSPMKFIDRLIKAGSRDRKSAYASCGDVSKSNC